MENVPLPPGLTRGSVASATSLWMLTTYLDDTLRVSRDDEGRVFVMLKVGAGMWWGRGAR